MSRRYPATLSLIVAAAAAAGAWYAGRQQGQATPAAPGAVAAAPADPSQWSIPQGEAATRRHIRDGIRAGDVDPATGRKVLNYHDPMVPGKNFDAPGKSPFMDMMLVPRYAGGGEADTGVVSVSPRIRQNLGLRTTPVLMGSLAPEVTAVGAVAWNERDQVLLQARATGFVEKLHLRAVFDRVEQGEPLAELYVPAWVAAQEEYLALARLPGNDLAPLVDAARQRMRLAGMDEAQIDTVVRSGRVQPRYTVTAPRSGIVTELMLREGATVMLGATLARVQGSASVWVEGEVPESQAALLRPGQRATATSPALPGARFEGRVQALLPEVDPATRTRKARLELANPGGRLVPGMTVLLDFDLAAGEPVLLLPTDAVIRTGRRSVVMLALGEGRFQPVAVTPGREANGQVEVRQGLQAGQQVVLAGQFLIDSEASLRGLEVRLNPADAGAAEAPPTYSTPARVLALEDDTVTLDHPPIAALKWPQMTMDFQLPPRAQRPRGLAAGDRVELQFRLQDGALPQIVEMRRLAAQAGR